MPIYEYRCRDCSHELESLQKLNEPALTDCPSCGASSLYKKVSAAGFRLKGAGWYETDFKAGGKRNLAGDSEAKPKADAPAAEGAKASAGTAASGSGGDAAASKPAAQKSADKPAAKPASGKDSKSSAA